MCFYDCAVFCCEETKGQDYFTMLNFGTIHSFRKTKRYGQVIDASWENKSIGSLKDVVETSLLKKYIVGINILNLRVCWWKLFFYLTLNQHTFCTNNLHKNKKYRLSVSFVIICQNHDDISETKYDFKLDHRKLE